MAARFVRGRLLITGPVLVGFNELFDRSYGDPKTPKPRNGDYPKITPSMMSGVMLPFVCVYCEAVQPIGPKQLAAYHDAGRGFSWCPMCRGRYVLDKKGQPLDEELPPDSDYAPALVDYGETTTVIGRRGKDGLNDLGVG